MSDDDVIGKVEEKVGWLTGDREAEAKGKLRRLKGEAPDTDDPEEEAAVEAASRDVREAYGEYDPDVDGADTATDERPAD